VKIKFKHAFIRRKNSTFSRSELKRPSFQAAHATNIWIIGQVEMAIGITWRCISLTKAKKKTPPKRVGKF
jgi:hypothetical protein